MISLGAEIPDAGMGVVTARMGISVQVDDSPGVG